LRASATARPFAVTVCNDRSSNSRHWFQPGGEIVGDRNHSPLSDFRLSCCNLDEWLLARQTHVLPVERRELAGAEPRKEADRYGGQQRSAFRVCGTQCKELLCLWYGENRNRIVDLACLVDVFGRIGISPTTFTGPSKKGSKVTDRRVAARGFLVFGEMFADLFVGDLVKIYFGRKAFGQEAQEGLIADNSVLVIRLLLLLLARNNLFFLLTSSCSLSAVSADPALS